jgi:hypothetical protein
MRARYILGASLAGACALSAGSASADTLTYFGYDDGLGEGTRLAATPNSDAARANFFSNLVGVGTETFESFAAGTSAPVAVTFGPDVATLNGTGSVESVPAGQTNGFGRYPISGTNYYEASGTFSIDFSAAQAAFGFYATDVGDFGGQVTLTLLSGATKVVTVPSPTNVSGGAALYFGIIETAPADVFTKVTFGNTAPGTDFFAFDDFSIGRREQVVVVNAVPLPAAAWGGMALLGGLGVTKRMRRRNDDALDNV